MLQEDESTEDELVIVIDGEASIEEQKEALVSSCSRFRSDKVSGIYILHVHLGRSTIKKLHIKSK